MFATIGSFRSAVFLWRGPLFRVANSNVALGGVTVEMRRQALSGYRMMWLYVMFDLPTGSRQERRVATRFRNFLLDHGFEMAQFSVYLRFAESKQAAEVHIRKIRTALPDKGKVHIVTITDKQYANARIFSGTQREYSGEKPSQLALF